MKTETILEREEYNKEHEDIVKSLDEIISALNRIEDKLSKIIGENPKRLNEDLNKGYFTYNALGEPVYMPYGKIVTTCTSKVDGVKDDFKGD